MERKKIVILGAGLSGLAAAEKLAKDFDVLVIESEKQTGGLAKTIKFNGHLLDFGPHPIYATERNGKKCF
jgi:protoporphyrinogen oxidase